MTAFLPTVSSGQQGLSLPISDGVWFFVHFTCIMCSMCQVVLENRVTETWSKGEEKTKTQTVVLGLAGKFGFSLTI